MDKAKSFLKSAEKGNKPIGQHSKPTYEEGHGNVY